MTALRVRLRGLFPAGQGDQEFSAISDDPQGHAVQALSGRGGARLRAVEQRLTELVTVLDGGAGHEQPTSITALLDRLLPHLEQADHSRIWLLLAVLQANLPTPEAVVATYRVAVLDGPRAAVVHAATTGSLAPGQNGPYLDVRVVTDQVVVDVHHTAQTDFATGIQRVTREATRRWMQWHEPLLLGWRPELSSLRALSAGEAKRACWGGPPVPIPDGPVVVPWRCTYVLPELAAEVTRTTFLQALAQYSTNTLNLIGYDLVPVTTAETSHIGLIPGFSRNLAAARYARIVVPISAGAAGEYRGWRDMLAGTGLPGPEIVEVLLPAQAPIENEAATARARDRLTLGSMPMVLVVGSHEPRKNHVAVLHAAELLWREGLAFSLTFIGGNSWNSEAFTDNLARLKSAGRPVEAISAADDDLLFGGYRSARFTVFPSLNEGFGLPVTESLSCGTPVITSRYGSMAEIGADGGALLVNPRDDHDLTDAMRRLLTDVDLHADLVAQARARPARTWDDYARATWALLVPGQPERTL